MTEGQERGATGGRGGREASPDLIDDALKLVDNLQRKLITAGVRRGVGAVTSAPAKEDVWEEAIRLEDPRHKPPLEEFGEIVRRTVPEVAGHLGRAGLALADAVSSTWDVLERGLEQSRSDAEAPGESSPDRDDQAKGGASGQITSGETEEGPQFSGGSA